ncbi:MAG: hypothetical protein ACLPIX_18505 [Rhodomicrobium sp.]
MEEMARRIFEEWFVHFRAPGCEGVLLADSPLGLVPKGWHVIKLSEYADAHGGEIRTGPFGGQLHQSDYEPEGIRSLCRRTSLKVAQIKAVSPALVFRPEIVFARMF